jgi:EmrB/QacA subfamily drug resistance transporter
MLGVASGAILVPLNSTMLAVALPSVMNEFGVSPAAVASLVTVYLGAVVIVLPLAGALGDRLGHRRIFLAGVGAFALSSLLAAAAGAFAVLLLARILQAASGSLISTSAVALVRAAAPVERRGAAFGLFDMLVTTSAAVGPFIGGMIVSVLDWRWTFRLAAPVATIAAVSVGFWYPLCAGGVVPGAASAVTPRPVDPVGLALLAGLLAALLALLLDGRNVGLPAGLAVPVLLGAALVWWERRVAHPAIDLRLFSRQAYSAAVAGVLGATVILHATLVLVPLLVERVLRGGPMASGLVLLGISGLSAVAAPIGGRWSDRVGRRAPAVIGSVITAAGLATLWLLVAPIRSPGASLAILALLLGAVGVGFGLAGSPRQAAAMESVGGREVGMAASTYYTGRYLGGVVGASLAGLVLGRVVTAGGISLGFAILSGVAAAVAIVSLGLPGQRRLAQ